MLKDQDLTGKIIGLAMYVHRELGPGFKENVYQKALSQVLSQDGLISENEVPFEVCLKGKPVGKFRVDLLIDKKIVVETKAISGKMPKIFQSQLVSYLKAAHLEVGLLLNFGNPSLEFKRIVN